MRFLVSALFALCLFVGSAFAANEYIVYVGAGGGAETDFFHKDAGYTMKYYPDNLIVGLDDIIRFRFMSDEGHTVSYSNGAFWPVLDANGMSPLASAQPPLTAANMHMPTDFPTSAVISSGVRVHGDPDYLLRATTPGTWDLYCLYHPGQVFRLTIVGGQGPSDVIANAAAYNAYAADVEHINELVENKQYQQPPASVLNADKKTRTHTIVMPAASKPADGFVHLLRFYPQVLDSVYVGDTIVFDASAAFAPHFIVIGESGWNTKFEEFEVVTNAAAHQIQVNFKYLAGATPSGSEHDGSKRIWSNFIAAPPVAAGFPGGTQKWSIKITKPGVYKYTYPIHDKPGMIGFIVVKPRHSHDGEADPNAVNINFASMFSGLNL